jgi:hypothetical protein
MANQPATVRRRSGGYHERSGDGHRTDPDHRRHRRVTHPVSERADGASLPRTPWPIRSPSDRKSGQAPALTLNKFVQPPVDSPHERDGVASMRPVGVALGRWPPPRCRPSPTPGRRGWPLRPRPAAGRRSARAAG